LPSPPLMGVDGLGQERSDGKATHRSTSFADSFARHSSQVLRRRDKDF
jgi:hypothetical protein